MRYTPWDPHVLVAFDTALLTRSQQSFVQQVLRSLDPDALLSNHSSAGSSAFLALVRAHDALAGNLEQRQPKGGLLQNIMSTAHKNLTKATPLFSGTSGDAKLRAAERLVAVIGSAVASASDSKKRSYIGRIARLIGPALDATKEWVAPLWAGTVSAEVAQAMTQELCVAVALSGRHGLNLKVEFLQLLMQGPPTVEQVAELLWPPTTSYPATLLVEGARELLHLEQLLPGSRQRPVAAADRPRQLSGYPSFARLSSRSASVLVQFPVDAPDIGTAMALGRRKLSEVLDQYAAGQRIVQLSLHPVIYAVTRDGATVQSDGDRGATSVARPLTMHWSKALGPALRQAHLAGLVDAPMATTSLCWSAVEALGMAVKDVPILAKACAMHLLRQQIVGSHVLLYSSAGAHLNHLVWRAVQTQSQLATRRRSIAACSARPDSARAMAAIVDHSKVVAELERELAKVQSAANDTSKKFNTQMAALATFVPVRNRRLADPDPWLDVLLPPRSVDMPDLVAARAAAESLMQEVGGVAGETLGIWRTRLKSPPALSQWLDGQVDVLSSLLYWMYSTRNATMHRGVFSGPADTLTAHGARAVVDLTLEFLSNWHTHEFLLGQAETPGDEIVSLLAQRMDRLTACLAGAQTNHALSLTHLTGPGFNPWSRA
jgi:nucleotide-binding universal stress UspA family protein